MTEQRMHIPVAFSCSSSGIPMLSVAILSISNFAHPDCIYDIYIIHTEQFDIAKANLIKQLLKPNIHLNYIDATNYVTSLQSLPVNYWFTIESYYRVLAPFLIPQHSKLIYLDCDTLVQTDIGNLYAIDISGYILAGTLNNMSKTYISNHLHIDPERYINTGVMIINCERYRQENVAEQCINLLLNDYVYSLADQDVLNIVCQDKVLFLDSHWNYGWHYPSEEYLQNYIPGIIHYAGPNKPWLKEITPLTSLFWSYAQRTPFYTELKNKTTIL